jgi:uncharacterized protein
MSGGLTIAAKAPLPGHVKTRLAARIGSEAAVELYRAFLSDLAARFPEASWYVDPLGAWQHAYPGTCAFAQPPGDWTDRQRAFFRAAAARGEERSVLTASDSPQLPRELVAEAFALLDTNDVVLGPVADGGYYLLGMRGWHDVLAGVAMSTSSVRTEIEQAARSRGLRLALLEPSYDIDELEDLELLRLDAALRNDLPATRIALRSLAAVPA